jgi:hypothetical protein
MSHRERKVFMVSNSLADIIQDIEPDPAELRSFFRGSSKIRIV